MYKILIADDEGIVIDALKFIIEKNFGADCQLCIAKTGRQAIEEAERFRPDIAFLDIQMPGINGLKAMEEIRRHNSGIKVLILTAYDNFDYAKEALRLGAVNYLMKPINKNVIIDQLTNIMHMIDEERKKRVDDLAFREKMGTVLPIIENGFAMSLIVQNESEDSTAQYRTLLDISEAYGVIMVLEWGEGREKFGMGNPVGSGIRAHKFYNKMIELVKVSFKSYISSIIGNKVICVVPKSEPKLEYNERLQMIEKVRHMTTLMNQMLDVDFRVGIGSTRPWSEIFTSYQEALNALRHGKRRVTHINDLIVRGTEEQQQLAMEKAVLAAVSKGLDHHTRQEAEVYVNWLFKSEVSFSDARIKLFEILALARREVREQEGGNLGWMVLKNLSDLADGEDPAKLKQWFVAEMVDLTQKVVIRKEYPESIVTKSLEYIEKHFSRDINLDEVAKSVNVSPYYFSKLFKEETGTNFIEYLTNLRIETAKRLLKERNLSIKEICIESGYSNPNYFSRIFKKWTGITPTEFRENLG